MQPFDLIDGSAEGGAGRETCSESFVDHFDLHIKALVLVCGAQLLIYVMGIVKSTNGVIIAFGNVFDDETSEGEIIIVPA